MSEPATNKPYIIEESPGKKFYCACGKSKKLPYCDGSHQGTDFKPYEVEITEKRKVAICCCNKSKKPPFCDGSHTKA